MYNEVSGSSEDREESGYLRLACDNFSSRIMTGCQYTENGLWVLWDQARRMARIGLSDYLRQNTGVVTFVELPERGMTMAAGEELANMETETADVSLPVPFASTVLALNEALQRNPEPINWDPYGAGWLVELRPDVWPVPGLLDAGDFVARVGREARQAS